MTILNKIKDIVLQAATILPLPVGVLIGYFGHGPIKLLVTIAADTIKLIFKI